MTGLGVTKRYGLLIGGAAFALMGVLTVGCSPRTEEPATTTSPNIAPTEKGAKGVQDPGGNPMPSGGPDVMGPDGTMNRGGGRPDTNDNGSWSQSASPGTTADPMQPPVGNN